MSQKFKSDIEVQAGLRDSSGSLGTSGQVLSTTGTGVAWINENQVAHTVSNQVKAGVAINKGQAVYVTGADGTNIIVGLASNTSEATSSKTLGLLDATVATNGFANVVEIGRLAGLNTLGANAGDPVWLGVNGNLIYGLANKPYAPAHLVFIGIVTRVNANNGEIFVNVQNGFELKEIHDVDIITDIPINGDVLGYNGTLWVNKTIAEWLGYTPANASGTTNYVSKFTGSTTLGNSQIFDNGTFVGIGTNSSVGNDYVSIFYNTATSRNQAINIKDINSSANGSIFSVFRKSDDTYLGAISRNGTSDAMFVYGNDHLALGSGATERMRITSSGNVGIGTTAPNFSAAGRTVLDINGTNNTMLCLSVGGTAGSYLYQASGNLNISNEVSGAIINYTGGLERMRITSSGNVGIGTTNPGSLLQVGQSNASTDALVRLSVSYSTDRASRGGITWNDTTNATGKIYTEYDGTMVSMVFGSLYNSGYNSNQSMIIRGNGNVGIGTTSPSEKLHISGNTLVTGTLEVDTVNNGVGDFLTRTAGGIVTRRTAAEVRSDIGAQAALTNPVTGTGTLNFVSKFTSTGSTLGNSQIFDNGNRVGIGSTTPGAKLEIFGGVLGSTAYDYVPTQVLNVGNTNGEAFEMGSIRTAAGSDWTTAGFRLQEKIDSTWMAYMQFNGDGNLGGMSFGTGYSATSRQSISERMRITDTGNVGIGTSNPQGKLAVDGGSIRFNYGNGTAAYYLYLNHNSSHDGGMLLTRDNSTFDWQINNLGANGDLHFYSYGIGSPALVLQRSSGNVGIGTTNPGAKLVVYSGASVTDYASFATGDGSNTIQYIPYVGTGDYNHLSYGGGSLLFNNIGSRLTVGTHNGTAIQFGPTNTLISGNVGIGTTNPQRKLDIVGDHSTSTFRVYYPELNVAGQDASVDIWASEPGISFNGSGIGSNVNGQPYYGRTNPALGQGFIRFIDGTTAFHNSSTNAVYSERMRITPSGNVGIGTTSPSSKLHVYSSSEVSRIESSTTTMYQTFRANGTNVGYIGNGTGVVGGGSATDFGIQAPNNFVFATGGSSERMRITSGGNVGIGTSSPSSMLTLNGTTPYIRIERSGVNTWQIQNNYLSVQNGFSVNNITAGTTPFFIGENGNVGIGTTSPGAKLDVNGDALINQLTIGQGPVVGQGNTALGKGALGSMVGGKSNIAVGSNANSDNDVTGLTVIGVDLNVNPAGSALTQDSLVIGQYNALNYSTQYPHIYAPDKVNCPNGNTTTDIIAVDYSIYTAIFMEYSIFNSGGDQFRAGTYTAAFKSTGTVVDDDNQTVVYSGTTLSATFTTSISGSVATIQLRNQDSDTYDIRVTARLLMR